MRPSWPSRSEGLFLLLCFLILAWQLLLPGFIGLANNGDFGKVTGPFCVGPQDRGADNFLYFQPNYIRGDHSCWRPNLPFVAIGFAWLADSLAGHPAVLDIRVAGSVYILLFLLAYWLILLRLRTFPVRWRVALSLGAILVFADAANATYLNSFYPDTPAILGALIAAFALPGNLLLYAVGGLLFVMSKSQHAIFAPVLAMAVLAFPSTWARVATAAAILAGSVYALNTPAWYPAQARFNVIFQRLGPSPELGLDDSYRKYTGMHCFMPNSPTENEAWMREFSARTSWRSILGYYLQHPGLTLTTLRSALTAEAFQRRAINLGNFTRASGKPPGTLSYGFALWSSARTWLFVAWPWHMPLALLMLMVGAVWMKDWKVLAVCLIACVEFGVGSLADTLETHRHLLLFHVLTDIAAFQFVMSWVLLASRTG